MDKKTWKTLQSLLQSIDTSVLVLKAVARVKEDITDSDTRLISLVNGLCDATQLLRELAEFHRDTCMALHVECKKEKNSQLQFQLRWYSYCSAFLLEERYSLAAINLEEVAHPVLTKLRQKWLDFCKEHYTSVIANWL